jgi:hypothetical protein
VSDRGTQFTSKFWERVHETLDSQLCFSSAYHPQTDGQTERVNQILEDVLRVYALQYRRSWDKSLSYVEFSYNDSYQESLKMVPFEMIYGRRCRIPLFWSETGEGKVFRLGKERVLARCWPTSRDPDTPGRPAKEVGSVGPTLSQLGPGFVPHHPLVSYSL